MFQTNIEKSEKKKNKKKNCASQETDNNMFCNFPAWAQ